PPPPDRAVAEVWIHLRERRDVLGREGRHDSQALEELRIGLVRRRRVVLLPARAAQDGRDIELVVDVLDVLRDVVLLPPGFERPGEVVALPGEEVEGATDGHSIEYRRVSATRIRRRRNESG